MSPLPLFLAALAPVLEPALRLPIPRLSIQLPVWSSYWACRIAGVAVAYYLLARLSLAIPGPSSPFGLMWLPGGLALAALLRGAFLFRAPVFATGDTEGYLAPAYALARGVEFDCRRTRISSEAAETVMRAYVSSCRSLPSRNSSTT